MPYWLVRMLHLDYLYPPFLEALLSALAECSSAGYDYKCYSGFRSVQEQQALYDKFLKGGSRAAPPGLSAHNYGLAIDCARIRPDNINLLTWQPPNYDKLVEVLSKYGLISGKGFGDLPHVQWPNFVDGKQLRKLRNVYNAANGTELEKLKEVWRFIDGFRSPTGP